MQKIMFNDRFLLTQAVLDGRKTQTRRLPSPKLTDKCNGLIEEFKITSMNIRTPFYVPRVKYFLLDRSPYKLGEIVAVAQSYYNAKVVGDTTVDYPLIFDDGDAGYTNKMFIKPSLMPHQIKITKVRVQRLQDITDEECLLEGIEKEERTDGEYNYIFFDAKRELYIRERTPRDAYARLIDMLSGKGTWDSNPYVFVFDFELVK